MMGQYSPRDPRGLLRVARDTVLSELTETDPESVTWGQTLAVCEGHWTVQGEVTRGGQSHSWTCRLLGNESDFECEWLELDGQRLRLSGVLSRDNQVEPFVISTFEQRSRLTPGLAPELPPDLLIQSSSKRADQSQMDQLRRKDHVFLAQGVGHLFRLPNQGRLSVEWTGRPSRNRSAVALGYWSGQGYAMMQISFRSAFTLTFQIERPADEPDVYVLVRDCQTDTIRFAVTRRQNSTPTDDMKLDGAEPVLAFDELCISPEGKTIFADCLLQGIYELDAKSGRLVGKTFEMVDSQHARLNDLMIASRTTRLPGCRLVEYKSRSAHRYSDRL